MPPMDESTQASTDTTQGTGTSAPESGSSAPAPQSTPDTSVQSGAQAPAQPGVVPAPQAYTPNWKFKANQKDHEIPELYRSIVKDAESEKKVKELFEKAYGLDEIKPKHQKTSERLQQLETKVMPEFHKLADQVSEAMFYRDNGDLDSLFDLLKLDEKKIAQHLLRKVQLREASPEQQAEYARQRDLTKQNLQLKRQNEQYSSQLHSTQTQNKGTELETAMSRQDVAQAAQAFDARFGQNAFRQRVIREAMLLEQLSGMDVSAEQAVTEVLRLMGPGAQPNPASAQVQPAAVTGAQPEGKPQGQNNPPPPVIPNVGARGTSPTKKLAKSLDEIRQKHREMVEASKSRTG